jgi:O-methyltransferase involved in polyketide biosynthesis
MEQKTIQNTIKDNVADTLYIPLCMKCRETRKPDPFFRDPVACELVDRLDYDFSKYNRAVRSSVGVAIRAKYFDDVTVEFIQSHKNPVVVHIGCGLDTRYQRIGKDVTQKAMFYELDIPEAIELREQLLPASGNDVYLKNSMFETGWMDDIKAQHPQGAFLFVVEGVFMYFEKEQVKSVLVNLAQRFPGGHILFDVTNSWMCKNSHRHDSVKLTNSPFRLALDDDKEIETWADTLKFVSVRYYSDFKAWERSGFFNYWAMRLITTIKRASRLLYYRIGEFDGGHGC